MSLDNGLIYGQGAILQPTILIVFLQSILQITLISCMLSERCTYIA